MAWGWFDVLDLVLRSAVTAAVGYFTTKHAVKELEKGHRKVKKRLRSWRGKR